MDTFTEFPIVPEGRQRLAHGASRGRLVARLQNSPGRGGSERTNLHKFPVRCHPCLGLDLIEPLSHGSRRGLIAVATAVAKNVRC